MLDWEDYLSKFAEVRFIPMTLSLRVSYPYPRKFLVLVPVSCFLFPISYSQCIAPCKQANYPSADKTKEEEKIKIKEPMRNSLSNSTAQLLRHSRCLGTILRRRRGIFPLQGWQNAHFV